MYLRNGDLGLVFASVKNTHPYKNKIKSSVSIDVNF